MAFVNGLSRKITCPSRSKPRLEIWQDALCRCALAESCPAMPCLPARPLICRYISPVSSCSVPVQTLNMPSTTVVDLFTLSRSALHGHFRLLDTGNRAASADFDERSSSDLAIVEKLVGLRCLARDFDDMARLRRLRMHVGLVQ